MFKKEKLAELLKKNNITQVQLANEIGVSDRFVSYVLKGFKQPSLQVAKLIADFVGVSLDDLTRD